MEGNMHQARSSKEMQYVEYSGCNGSLFNISASQECVGEKKPRKCYVLSKLLCLGPGESNTCFNGFAVVPTFP